MLATLATRQLHYSRTRKTVPSFGDAQAIDTAMFRAIFERVRSQIDSDIRNAGNSLSQGSGASQPIGIGPDDSSATAANRPPISRDHKGKPGQAAQISQADASHRSNDNDQGGKS